MPSNQNAACVTLAALFQSLTKRRLPLDRAQLAFHVLSVPPRRKFWHPNIGPQLPSTNVCSGASTLVFITLTVILRQAFRLGYFPRARRGIFLLQRTTASMSSSLIGSMVNGTATPAASASPALSAKRQKLTGRAFYRSLGSPKMILAPMVDQSEFVRCFICLSSCGRF